MNPPVPLPTGARLRDPAVVGATLADLGPGDHAIVQGVRGRGEIRRRLLEMGFVSGTPLRVVRLAPLADPMEVELHGYHLSLRRSEARTILIRRDASDRG